MVCKLKLVEEERSDLKVLRKGQASSWLVTFGKTKDTICVAWNTILVTDQEESDWVHAERERFETDLIFDLSSLKVDETTILLADGSNINLIVVRRSIWIVFGSGAVLAISTFDG